MPLLALLLCALAALAGCAGGAELVAAGGGDVAPVRCSRASPCLNFGNCELHTGTCACPIGYGGARCEKALLSACALTRSPPAGRPTAMQCPRWHHAVGASSCDCMRQCMAHMPANTVNHLQCFERPGGVEAQTSDFPAADEAGVVFRISSSLAPEFINATESREEHLRMQEKRVQMVSAPQRECKDSCNFEGHCFRETEGNKQHRCFCHIGYRGEACEQSDPTVCINGCSGHGTCFGGFCSCQMGFFGIDCSINLDAASEAQARADPVAELDMPTDDPALLTLLANSTSAGAAYANPRALEIPPGARQELLRPRVYVYELPPWLAQSFELEGLNPNNDIYGAFYPTLSLLLHDNATRTLDPWEANLFYVPAFTYATSGNGGRPHDHVRRVLRFIRAEYPALWARRGGRDHIVWAPGDRGVCPLPPDLENLIWLVHYGAEHVEKGSGDSFTLKPEVDPFNSSMSDTCFKPERGIVMPPKMGDMLNQQARATYGPNAEHAPRDTLLFFVGGFRMEHKQYSQGVRQRLFELYSNGSVPDIVITRSSPDMALAMRKSKFCLAPMGYGWGSRLSHAMVNGCVPVIIQDSVHQAFDDLLPYAEFSIRVPQSELDQLETRLRAVAPAKLRALQHGVRRFHRAFTWPQPGAAEEERGRDAYYWFVKSLHARLQAVLAGFHH